MRNFAEENHLEYEIVGGIGYTHSPNILCVRFPGVDAQTLVLLASSVEVYISAGSACSSNSSTPSHVLIAMGYNEDAVRECIRFSFCSYTPAWQVIDGMNLIAKLALQIRDLKDKL